MTSKMGRPKKITLDETKNLNEDEYYTINELAEKLKVNRRTITRLIDRGEIKPLRVGKQYRIKKSDFKLWREIKWQELFR